MHRSSNYYERLLVMMIALPLTCHVTTSATRDSNTTTTTGSMTEMVGYTNASLQLNCSNSSSLFDVSWTKDRVKLKVSRGSRRVTITRNGRLHITRLNSRHDAGTYVCMTRANTIIQAFHLIVIDKPKMSHPYVSNIVTNSKSSSGEYSLPDWMTGVACATLISMVTIIIIVAYIKISKPKKSDLINRFAAPTVDVEIVEVITDGVRPCTHEKEHASLGGVRQRKSTSSTSSSIEESFQLQSPKYCSSRKERDLGIGEAVTIPLHTAFPITVDKTSTTESKPLRKIKSEPCNAINKEEKDFDTFMLHYSRSMSKYDKNGVRSEPTLTEKTVDYRRDESRPNKVGHIPGKALRKMASEPYCVESRYAAKKSSNIATGQALRKVVSEPSRRTDTVYCKPVIRASLGYNQNELYSKVQKLKKSKSDKTINKTTKLIESEVVTKKTKQKRASKVKETGIQFPNPIYARIEDITSHITQPDYHGQDDMDMDRDDHVYHEITDIVRVPYGTRSKHKHNRQDKNRDNGRDKRNRQDNNGDNDRDNQDNKVDNDDDRGEDTYNDIKHGAPHRRIRSDSQQANEKDTKRHAKKNFTSHTQQQDSAETPQHEKKYENHGAQQRRSDSQQANEKDTKRHAKKNISSRTQQQDSAKTPQHEKKYENFGFSFNEDLEDFGGDFDEEPNYAIDRIYNNVLLGTDYASKVRRVREPNYHDGIDRMYDNVLEADNVFKTNCVRELPRLPDDGDGEESLYEELFASN